MQISSSDEGGYAVNSTEKSGFCFFDAKLIATPKTKRGRVGEMWLARAKHFFYGSVPYVREAVVLQLPVDAVYGARKLVPNLVVGYA